MLADASGKGRNATATGVTWGDGWIDGAAQFTGTGSAATAGPVLRTDRSFTVSAWLRLDAKADWRTALSQDGSASSAFYFQYNKTLDRWGMIIRDTDGPGGIIGAFSADPPSTGVWTHVTGVYDHAAGKLLLYLDGALEAEAAGVTGWHGGGRLAIGRAINASNLWAGAIDDVRVYTGVLSEDEIADLAAQ